MIDGAEMKNLAIRLLAVAIAVAVMTQLRKPWGWLGRLMLWRMNWSHDALTDWGLTYVAIDPRCAALDVGCGGGRTVQKLAKSARDGTVVGLDYSSTSVAESRRTNAPAIADGRVEIRKGSVSSLPFDDRTFDLVTAVETHYYWPDLVANLREILRVLRPGGTVAIVAEACRTSRLGWLHWLAMKPIGGDVLSADEHRDRLVEAGYSEVEIHHDEEHGWICALARAPASTSSTRPSS